MKTGFLEAIFKPHSGRINDLFIFHNSLVTVSSDKFCKLTDLETLKVISSIPYSSTPCKTELLESQQFIIVADQFGSIYFHDFRQKVGAQKLVDSSKSLVTCFIKNDFDVFIFDQDKNSRLIDFRTNQIVIDKKLAEVVRCGVPTIDPRFVIVADHDVRLVNKLSLDVKLVHKIDKGPIYSMVRVGSQLFTGGFDKELKVGL